MASQGGAGDEPLLPPLTLTPPLVVVLLQPIAPSPSQA